MRRFLRWLQKFAEDCLEALADDDDPFIKSTRKAREHRDKQDRWTAYLAPPTR